MKGKLIRPTRIVSLALTTEVLEKVDEECRRAKIHRSVLIDQILRKHYKIGYILRE